MQTNFYVIADPNTLASLLVRAGAIAIPVGLMVVVLGLTYASIVVMLRLAWSYRNQILNCISFVMLPFLRLCDWIAET